MRRSYSREQTGLTLGINQQKDRSVFEECADALNVWAPRGTLEQRPGYAGIGRIESQLTNVLTITVNGVVKESPLGTYTATTTLNSLPVGDRWYLFFASSPAQTGYPSGVKVRCANTNSNPMKAVVEYWNGASWVWLNAPEVNINGVEHIYHLNQQGGSSSYFLFPWPADIASTTLAGVTGYPIRFTLQAFPDVTTHILSSAFDSTVSINTSQCDVLGLVSATRRTQMFATLLSGVRRYIGRIYYPGTSVVVFNRSLPSAFANKSITSTAATDDVSVTQTDIALITEPATLAVAPQFGEAFMAQGGSVTMFTSGQGASGTNCKTAQVESRDFAVGPNAPNDKNFVPQLNAFPRCKYITYFNNRLWFAGIEGDPTTIRWGAAAPFYKVLPIISAEPVIASDDQTPITGMAPLGEQLVVFKEKSIYVMVNNGLNAFGQTNFVPVRRVSGIGCVAQSSIQQVRDVLVFLAKDGLYQFDGVNVKKISEVERDGEIIDRLKDYWGRIVPGKRVFCSSINYRRASCYFISLCVDGAPDNNSTLVWDYEHDSLWLWSNIEATQWIEDTDGTVYFSDAASRLFLFGNAYQDHGAAISSYAITQRVGADDRNTDVAREVEVAALNLSSSIGVEILPDDATSGAYGNQVGTISLTDPAEKNFDVAVFDTDQLTLDRQRRARIGVRQVCNYYQVKVSHSTKGTPFALSKLLLGGISLGAR